MVPPLARRQKQAAKGKPTTPSAATPHSQTPRREPRPRLSKGPGRAADAAGELRHPAAPLAVPQEHPLPPSLTDLWPEATITVKEAAFRLCKSQDTVYRWLRSGRLQGRQPGGPGCSIQVVESSVLAAMQHGFRGPLVYRGLVRASL